MRTFILSTLSVAVLFLGTMAQVGCSSQTEASLTEIKLPSVQCEACALKITTALKKEAGVKEVNVDLEKKLAKFSYVKAETDPGKLEIAITKAGYDANSRKADQKAYDGLPGCCKVSDHQH